MKKRLFLALFLALAVMLNAIPAMAASSVDTWLEADQTSINAGSSITITVYAEVDSCGGGACKISFDSDVFSLTSGKSEVDGAAASGFYAATKSTTFAFSDSSPVSGAISQFNLIVNNDAPSGSHTVTVVINIDGITNTRTLTITVACDHTYDNGCDETCNRCGGTRQVSHNWGSGTVTSPASCSKEGVKTYTCSSCGKTKTEKVDKTAHKWGAGTVITEATCDREGKMSYTCSACGTTKTEAVDTLEHNFEVVHYVEATCTENGEISFECVDCGYYYDDYIEAGGHTYENDCDEECDVCGELREVEHSYVMPDEDSEEPVDIPWLSDKRGHWQECQVCGKPQEPTPHTPGPEATETEDQVCLDCGFIIKAASAHTHQGSGNFLSNDEKHWFACACGELMGENDHHWEDKGIQDGQQVFKCIICSHVRYEAVETTAPTEETTAPTEEPTLPPTQPTEPKFNPIDHVGILVNWWWVIPVALIFLFVFGVGVYTIIGWIVGVGKKGKFDAKKRK